MISELSEKTCPSATLFTTNSTWTGVRIKPGLRGESPPEHGTAGIFSYSETLNVTVSD
jgi:hypothetical protein